MEANSLNIESTSLAVVAVVLSFLERLDSDGVVVVVVDSPKLYVLVEEVEFAIYEVSVVVIQLVATT